MFRCNWLNSNRAFTRFTRFAFLATGIFFAEGELLGGDPPESGTQARPTFRPAIQSDVPLYLSIDQVGKVFDLPMTSCVEGREYSIDLRIENNTEQSFSSLEWDRSCSCVGVTSGDSKLSAGELIDARIRFRPTASARFAQSISLNHNPTTDGAQRSALLTIQLTSNVEPLFSLNPAVFGINDLATTEGTGLRFGKTRISCPFPTDFNATNVVSNNEAFVIKKITSDGRMDFSFDAATLDSYGRHVVQVSFLKEDGGTAYSTPILFIEKGAFSVAPTLSRVDDNQLARFSILDRTRQTAGGDYVVVALVEGNRVNVESQHLKQTHRFRERIGGSSTLYIKPTIFEQFNADSITLEIISRTESGDTIGTRTVQVLR